MMTKGCVFAALLVLALPSLALAVQDERDGPSVGLPVAEERDILAWLQKEAPEQYAALLATRPEMVLALREGTESRFADGADYGVHDIAAQLTGVQPGYDGPDLELQAWLRELVGSGGEMDAAAVAESLPPPSRWYREFHPTCDADGDGRSDGVSLDFFAPYFLSFEPYLDPMWGYQWGRSEIRHINGTDGTSDWPLVQQNGGYLPMVPPPFSERVSGRAWVDWYIAPSRTGTPNPDYNLWNGVVVAPPDVMKVLPDLNGDGACEVAGFGFFTADWPLGYNFCTLLRVCMLELGGSLRVHDGATGYPLWELPLDTYFQDIAIAGEIYEYRDYPTGWQVFESPTGPKIAWKTTDINYTFEPITGNRDYTIREEYQVFDAATGVELKQAEVTHRPGGNPRITWFNGAADLGGDGEFELVFDQKIESVGLAGGEPEMGAMRGELQPTDASNNQLWVPVSFYTPPESGTQDLVDPEGIGEAFVWHHASVTGDVTGDGVPDPIGTYFTIPDVPKVLVNEDFKTHIAPVWGNNGSLVWGPRTLQASLFRDGQDIKVQGWGYVRAMPGADGVGDRLVVGTADFPTELLGQGQPAGARFPVKDNHVKVLSGKDGSAIVSWREQWGTDSFVVYDLTVAYSRDGLGIVDLTGDGLPDLVTPAQAVPIDSATQRLLGQVEHKYEVLDASDGDHVSTVRAWGGIGTPLPCPTHDSVVIASGHGRRVDVSRFQAHSGEMLWRNPFFNNPTPKAQTVGTELMFLQGGCAVNEDGGAVVGLNVGLTSLLRGFEVQAPLGLVEKGDVPVWLQPDLVGEAPLKPSIDFVIVPEPDLAMTQQIGWIGTSSVGGVVAGVVASFVRARRWGL